MAGYCSRDGRVRLALAAPAQDCGCVFNERLLGSEVSLFFFFFFKAKKLGKKKKRTGHVVDGSGSRFSALRTLAFRRVVFSALLFRLDRCCRTYCQTCLRCPLSPCPPIFPGRLGTEGSARSIRLHLLSCGPRTSCLSAYLIFF